MAAENASGSADAAQDERPPERGAGWLAPVTWSCTRCARDVTVPAWVLLDMNARPDLWPTARNAVRCPGCSGAAPRQPSLFLTGLPVGVPLLVVRDEAPPVPEVVRICTLDEVPPLQGFDDLGPHAPLIRVSSKDADAVVGSDQLSAPLTRVLDESRRLRTLQSALIAAISATSADELAAAVHAHGALLSPAVAAEWRAHGVHEDPELPRTPAQRVLDDVPETLLNDLPAMPPDEAWQRYVERVGTVQQDFADEIEARIAAVVSAHERGEANRELADRCVQLAELVVPELVPGLAGNLWATRALMLLSPQMSAPDDIDDAIEALEHAIGLYRAANEPAAVAEARSNLVIALHTRPRERERNLERGIAELEELVTWYDDLPDPDRAALVRTNLAVALLDRKSGDLLDNARRALRECEAALRHRSRERNPVDYAFTLTNKAVAHSRFAPMDPAQRGAAEQAYEEALRVLPPNKERALRGRILFNFADLALMSTKDGGGPDGETLARAEAHAREAVREHEAEGHVQELAFVRRLLARILVNVSAGPPSLARMREARGLLFESLRVLTPQLYPADCIPTADAAVAVCQDLDDWQGASLASLTALSAWLASGGDTVGREHFPPTEDERDPVLAEMEHDSRFRFTAYTLFRAARQRLADGAEVTDPQVQETLDHAVGIMERGRAITLRAASGADVRELQVLRSIDPQLADLYLSAVDRLRTTSHAGFRQHMAGDGVGQGEASGTSAAEAGLALERLLSIIRALPGLADFAQGQPPSTADLRAALGPGQALVYLIAHPSGCCALIVTSAESPAAVVPVDLPSTNGARLLTLILGVGWGDDGRPDGLTPGRPRAGEGLLTGPESVFRFSRFRHVLRRVLAEIGNTVVRPLAHALSAHGVTDAVIVPCGLLPAFAWHAATWRAGRGTTSLPDVLNTLSYAPSGGAWLAARGRVTRLGPQPPFLVGLANPRGSRPPLPGAEAELRHVATQFSGQSVVAYDSEATGDFLLGHLSQATHLHLGCHGTMTYDSIDGASLTLAEAEQLDMGRIRGLAGDNLRLVVVAACVSGAVNVILQPEESHALTIGFMHAGAAGVLGALWPIPDLPTTLFITRFYEELAPGTGTEPALALARTQRWMRGATSTDVRAYVAERPALDGLHGGGRLRGAVGDSAGRRGSLRRALALPRRRPFAAPEFWAAFVLNGC
ncbi:CHAT domain-containing protein [Streptomyces sp. NPDC058305]|uniref:CHAT domain-containing protein n=1 Tax=Streptomyces sp. NPDC058305 TaxID=3346438 RepID=UPI0036EDB97C